MVNLMRLEAANQGVAVAEAATGAALSYAHERLQGGKSDAPPVPIADHADVRRMLITMRTETESMRALVLETAYLLDLARASEDPDERRDAQVLADLLLPVCKAKGAETGFTVANMAMQVFGGHGYIKDFGVEQMVRDSRVISIYEGTHGIQALDLVTRKLANPELTGWRLFSSRIEREIATHPTLATETLALQRCFAALRNAVEYLPTMQQRATEAGASALLDLFGLTAAGWMWLRMLRAADNSARGQMIRACAKWWSEQTAPMVNVFGARVRAGAATLDMISPSTLHAAGEF
jgi:hypothetical protein